MIRHKNIIATLRTNLLDNVNGLPSDRSWENKEFNKPESNDWIRETYLPGDEVLSANGRTELPGVYAIDLFTKRGNDVDQVSDLADDIKEAFKPTTSFSNPDITIERATRGTGDESGDWYMIPIRISFRTFSNL